MFAVASVSLIAKFSVTEGLFGICSAVYILSEFGYLIDYKYIMNVTLRLYRTNACCSPHGDLLAMKMGVEFFTRF